MKRFLLALPALSLALSACGKTASTLPFGGSAPNGAYRTSLAQPHAGKRASFIYFAGYGNQGSNGFGPEFVGVYSATANGDVAPLHEIVGNKTQFVSPDNAWLDVAHNRVWTCDFNTKVISAFALGKWGNVRPAETLTITPPIKACGGMGLSDTGAIYATDYDRSFIAQWPAGSTGTVKPKRKIIGDKTHLYHPSSIAFDRAGNLIVSEYASILVFSSQANGNAAPLRIISGSNTQLSSPFSVAFDAGHDLIYAADERHNSIAAYAADANANVAPKVLIAGNKTRLHNPYGVAVDDAGYIYVGNAPQNEQPPQGSLLVFAPGSNGNLAPVQVIAGPKTGLGGVLGMTLAPGQ